MQFPGERLNIFRFLTEFHHALVIGIHIQFVVICRQGPVIDGAIHLFHLQVGALDDADLNGAPPSARCYAPSLSFCCKPKESGR